MRVRGKGEEKGGEKGERGEGEPCSANLQWSGDAVQTGAVGRRRKWRRRGGGCEGWGQRTAPPGHRAPAGCRVWAGGVAWRQGR